ncbi:unnamed protein product [Diabrotica balteata]|uniref:Uncharacterized protein n=1 Tax=Diabrotica balteata TaxID=107213 RepID=A0A9N9T8E0_DIABA|nr:unnamed protein product [Diabrotica balteata]
MSELPGLKSKSNNAVMANVPRTRGRILLELANELQENKEDTNTIITSQHQEPEPEYSADRKNNVLEWVKSNKFNVYENDDPQNSHSDSDNTNSTDEYNQSHISRSYVSDSVDLDSDISSNILIVQEPIVVNRSFKNEVFTKMKADQISLVAKRDPLIRHFGENYLKKHKRAQISVACSNKMRECSRLLIEMRRHTEKKNLPFFDILNPMLFDTVVASARLISGYNEETKIYKAPSLAMHLGTTLKQICDLCSHLLMKDHPDILCNDKDAKLKELKRFKLLVNSQWSFEISSLAVKDLAEKKWNKPVLLPLTKDIIKFRNHVVNCAETNFELLQQDWTNQQAFKKVVDSALS